MPERTIERTAHLRLDLLAHGGVAAQVHVARRVAEELPNLGVLPADQVLHVRLRQVRAGGGSEGAGQKTEAVDQR